MKVTLGKSTLGKGRSKLLCKNLGSWFERQKRVLPWRDNPTLYRVWVSEIMLQQTQVATVIPYFERFIAQFPDVETLAQASEEEVFKLWAGLGYYSRARNILRGARAIRDAGRMPRDRSEWEAIPGVGPYTAGAILSIALNLPEAILDGNVERVLARVEEVTRHSGDAQYKEKLWALSHEVVSVGAKTGLAPSIINQALMELGALVCTPRKPECERCPISKSCGAHLAGTQEAYPPRKKPKEWLHIREEVHCWMDGEGKVLLRRRLPGEWRAGLWDFLDSKPEGAKSVGQLESRHVVTRHKITRVTHFWRVTRPGNLWKAAEHGDDFRWVSLAAPEVAVGAAIRKVIQSIDSIEFE